MCLRGGIAFPDSHLCIFGNPYNLAGLEPTWTLSYILLQIFSCKKEFSLKKVIVQSKHVTKNVVIFLKNNKTISKNQIQSVDFLLTNVFAL